MQPAHLCSSDPTLMPPPARVRITTMEGRRRRERRDPGALDRGRPEFQRSTHLTSTSIRRRHSPTATSSTALGTPSRRCIPRAHQHHLQGFTARGPCCSPATTRMGWSTTIIPPPDGDVGAYLDLRVPLDRPQDRRLYPTHGVPVEEHHEPWRHPRSSPAASRHPDPIRHGSEVCCDIVDVLYADVRKELHNCSALAFTLPQAPRRGCR